MGCWEARCELTMDILVRGIRSKALDWMQGWGILTEKSSVDFLPTSQAHRDATCLGQLGVIETLLIVHSFARCTPTHFWGPWHCAWHSNPPGLAASLCYKLICFYAPSCPLGSQPIICLPLPHTAPCFFILCHYSHLLCLRLPSLFSLHVSELLHILSGLIYMPPLDIVMPSPPKSGGKNTSWAESLICVCPSGLLRTGSSLGGEPCQKSQRLLI